MILITIIITLIKNICIFNIYLIYIVFIYYEIGVFSRNDISLKVDMKRLVSAILISRERTKSPKIEGRKWQFN